MAYAESTASAEPEVETDIGDEVVAGIVADKQEKLGNETVGEFADDVEAQAEEKIEVIREHAGDAVADTVGPEIMEAAEGYSEAKNNVLDPNAKVGNGEPLKASAWVDMNNREMYFDKAAMKPGMSSAENGYWDRTKEHEWKHQREQATKYNAKTLYVPNEAGNKMEKVDVNTTLVEGHATQVNIATDLTPDYQRHQQDYRRIGAKVGKQNLDRALQSGNIQALNRESYRKVFGNELAMR